MERLIRIILAEADDPRVAEAFKILRVDSSIEPVLLGRSHTTFDGLGADIKTRLVDFLREKLDTATDAQALLRNDTKYLAAALVAIGEAQGYVAGNLCPTAETIRPALKLIGTHGYASSYFIIKYQGRTLLFADCAFNIEPTAEQLSRIALDTAASARSFGVEPRIAFLSFSTKGSAKHASVDKMRTAYELAKRELPDTPMDGELQFDAAFIPEIGVRKGSSLGSANVFIFPDLNSGNIAYKIAERMAGAQAIGPIMQGFKKPVNDLSRGCSVQDIVDVVAITAMQARL